MGDLRWASFCTEAGVGTRRDSRLPHGCVCRLHQDAHWHRRKYVSHKLKESVIFSIALLVHTATIAPSLSFFSAGFQAGCNWSDSVESKLSTSHWLPFTHDNAQLELALSSQAPLQKQIDKVRHQIVFWWLAWAVQRSFTIPFTSSSLAMAMAKTCTLLSTPESL